MHYELLITRNIPWVCCGEIKRIRDNRFTLKPIILNNTESSKLFVRDISIRIYCLCFDLSIHWLRKERITAEIFEVHTFSLNTFLNNART